MFLQSAQVMQFNYRFTFKIRFIAYAAKDNVPDACCMCCHCDCIIGTRYQTPKMAAVRFNGRFSPSAIKSYFGKMMSGSQWSILSHLNFAINYTRLSI